MTAWRWVNQKIFKINFLWFARMSNQPQIGGLCMSRKDNQSRNGTKRKASTLEILGALNGQAKIDPRWRKHHDILVSLRDTMLRRKGDLAETARQEQPGYSLHMADAGTDQYDMDFALSMISSDQNSIYEIEEALNRIRTGRYGICEVTGNPIEPERLEAIPWTRFSMEAQRQLEAHGSIERAKLGVRHSVTEGESAREEEDAGGDEE
jgi:RNA polymerase-binding transcription factor DksA